MDAKIAHDLLEEVIPSLESLETENAAILQLLKEKGIVNDDDLAPHLERAGNASNVRWRAARLRIDRLLSSAAEALAKERAGRSPEKSADKAAVEKETPHGQQEERSTTAAESDEGHKDKDHEEKRKAKDEEPEKPRLMTEEVATAPQGDSVAESQTKRNPRDTKSPEQDKAAKPDAA